MNEVKKKRIFKAAAVIFWILSVVCCGIIFWLSAQVADESAELSYQVQGFLGKLLGMLPGINLVRKCAHMLEYCGLSLLVSFALYFTCGKQKRFTDILICFLYSVTDEIHQHFVPGRACLVFDMFIDTLGAAITVIFVTLFFIVLAKIKNRRGKDENK